MCIVSVCEQMFTRGRCKSCIFQSASESHSVIRDCVVVHVVSLSAAVTQESLVDSTEKIVTTPAFMCEAGIHEIFDGIGAMISHVLKLSTSK